MYFMVMYVLEINHLDEVLRILRKYNFDGTDYDDLGIGLGLLYPIKAIKPSNCREDPKSFLRECLVKWLEKADEVEEKGGPTWYALVEALRSINKAVADAVHKESKTSVFSFIIN